MLSGKLFVSLFFQLVAEDQKKALNALKKLLCMHLCYKCESGHLQKEKQHFLWFQSVKSRQVKFVCIVQYPIQCLSGLYRLTATTAQIQSFRRDKEIKKATPPLPPKKTTGNCLRGNSKRYSLLSAGSIE